MREKMREKKSCQFCEGDNALYQQTNTTKLYINTFGKARTLEVECNPCPPHADCSAKNIPTRSAFIIKYCPECGRKLEG